MILFKDAFLETAGNLISFRRYYGPKFLSGDFVAWAESAGMFIHYIQPGEPNQNAYIERFNRTYREEVLNLYLFRNLAEVREPPTGG